MNPSFLLALRRRLPLVLLVPLAVGLIVFVTTPARDDAQLWTASETITYEPGSTSINDSKSRVSQVALAIKQPAVSDLAAREYGGTDLGPRTFASRLDVFVDKDALTITLVAEGEDPKEVERYVGAFAKGFVQYTVVRANEVATAEVIKLEGETERAQRAYDAHNREFAAELESRDPAALAERARLFDELDDVRDELRDKRRSLEFARSQYAAVGTTLPEEVEPATLGFLGNGLVRGLMAAGIALVGMIGLVAVLEKLAPRVSDRDHVEEIAGVPVLTMVPQVRVRKHGLDRLDPDHFTGPLAEAYRTLRVHLQFLAQPATNGNGNGHGSGSGSSVPGAFGVTPSTTVAVVSSAPGEGKTTTAALLAMSFAEVDTDTLVLGCDFRRPAIHERFGIPRSPGFTDRRTTTPAPRLPDLIHRDPITGVRVLPSGHATSRFHDLTDVQAVIEAGRAVGQQIVIDSAPILVASETAEIASMADHVVLVVRAGRTSVRALREAVTTMRLNKIHLAGVVLIGALEASDYAYYYTQYRTQREERRPALPQVEELKGARP